jgi:hypothetical protein
MCRDGIQQTSAAIICGTNKRGGVLAEVILKNPRRRDIQGILLGY